MRGLITLREVHKALAQLILHPPFFINHSVLKNYRQAPVLSIVFRRDCSLTTQNSCDINKALKESDYCLR